MSGLNKVMLIGRLGKDPEVQYTQSGVAVCKFSIATSEQWTDKNSGDKQEKTEWHNIVSFGKQGETLGKYLSKGSQVYIEGKLQTSNYEKDGQTHYKTDIVVEQFTFLSGGSNDRQGGQDNNQNRNGGGGYHGGGGYQQS